MSILFHAASSEELEQGIRFRTYLKYLQAFSDLSTQNAAYPESLIRGLTGSVPFKAINGGKCKDIPRLGQLLRNAWFTELQLNLPSKFPDLVPYSIHWAGVQAYYSVYLLLRAYFYASGQDVPNKHAHTLGAIANEIRSKNAMFPSPWNAFCDDSPAQPIYGGIPVGVSMVDVSALKNYDLGSAWSWHTMFLKTTRQRQLEKLVDDWKAQQKRRRVSPKVKAALIRNLNPTTAFACLYRLRIRSNYEDADSFLLGALQAAPAEAEQFHGSICNIVWDAGLILEALIARHIGKKAYKEILAGFVENKRLEFSRSLAFARWTLLASSW